MFKTNLLVLILLISLLIGCVPIKKQIFFRDLSKKNLNQIRKTDTILAYPAYVYKLQPKDIISIKLTNVTKGEFDLSQLSEQGNAATTGLAGSGSGYMVSDSGFIFIPLMGKLKVVGLTLKEAQSLIQKNTDLFFDNTIINVKLISFTVYLLGETTFKGKVLAPSDRLTVLDLLAMTGGVTEFGDYRHIRIIRNIDNKAHIYYVNALDQNLITKNTIYLMPNDIVFVEPLRLKTFRNYALNNFQLGVTSVTLLITLYLSLNSFLRK